MQTPRTEFAQAIKAIATERGLDSEIILDTIKQAIIAAYKRDARERGEDTEGFDYDVELNPATGEARVFAWPAPELEETPEGEEPPVRVPSAPPEDKKDVTPPGFGRIAAQTAKQVIHQKIKEAERDSIMDEYSDRVGNLISGMVLRFDGPNVRVDLGRTEGIMLSEDRVPNERLSLNQRLSFLLKEIEETPRGKQLVLSRSGSEFVEKLFEREVPEIGSGSVEVRGIVREPGVRSKIAVYSGQSGVDPVGSCVGQKGVRVQAVTNELGGERVDIVPWTDNEKDYIKASLSPAEGLEIILNKEDKVAIVKAPEDQLSMAIGKDGQNVRLASRLTGWRIEVESETGKNPEDLQEDDKKEDVAGELVDKNVEKDDSTEILKEVGESSNNEDKVDTNENLVQSDVPNDEEKKEDMVEDSNEIESSDSKD